MVKYIDINIDTDINIDNINIKYRIPLSIFKLI